MQQCQVFGILRNRLVTRKFIRLLKENFEFNIFVQSTRNFRKTTQVKPINDTNKQFDFHF